VPACPKVRSPFGASGQRPGGMAPLHWKQPPSIQLWEPVPDTVQPPFDSSAPRLQVCHVISSFHPVIAGAERATQTLVKALRERDHDVLVLTRRYSRDVPAFEQVDGIPVYRLGRPGRGKLNALTFGLHALVLLAWRLRDRRIIHVQNIDTPLLVGLLARSLLRRQLVATIHGHTPIMGRNTRLRGRLRTSLMARVVQRFTSINPENTSVLVGLGVRRDHVYEIPNGVDMTVFRPAGPADRDAARSELGLGADEFVVVYIGRLVSWKRVDLLIDAWSRLEPADRGRLLIVGDGQEAPALRAAAQRVGADVRMEGSSDRPVIYLRAADVYVNPSGDNRLQGEGLSVALLEAMATGVPPIVTQGPGNDVLVEDGTTGLNFPVQDAEALRTCLQRMRLDPSLRSRLGRGAHELVWRRYSIEAVAEQVEAVYLSLDGVFAR
jgi:glycosyltransferase involved in cell wall biosynthesis